MTASPPVPPENSPGRKIRRFRQGALLAVGIGIFILFLWQSGVSASVFYQLRSPGFLVLGVALAFLVMAAAALRTKVLLLSLGVRTGTGILIRIEFIHYFLQTVLPFRLNLPAKAWVLRQSGVASFPQALSVTTFDYLIDTGTLLGIVFLIGPLFVPGLGMAGLSVAMVAILGLLATYLALPARVFGVLRFPGEPRSGVRRIWNRVLDFTLTLRATWFDLLRRRTSLGVVPVQAAVVVLQLFATQALLLSAGVWLPLLGLLVAINATAFIGGITTIPAGGLGVRDAAMAILLNRLGAPLDVSLYAVLMSRLTGLIPVAIGYLLSLRFGTRWLSPPAQPEAGAP
ncbi:MAG: lysylphosphatidylglycerol synthase transmembrane domain-containing protein [Halobacteria archaeon]